MSEENRMLSDDELEKVNGGSVITIDGGRYDVFDNNGNPVGRFDTLEEAIKYAETLGGEIHLKLEQTSPYNGGGNNGWAVPYNGGDKAPGYGPAS